MRRRQQLLRVDRLRVPVVGQHVGQAHERGLALGVVGVVALDGHRQAVRQRPAAGQHAADERVVDAQLEALLVQALLGRAGVAVDLRGIAGIGVAQDELADVVQERRAEQLVAVLVARARGRAGRRRPGWRRRAAGSARASGPSPACARRSRRWRARAASVSTPSGERISIASGMPATLPFLRVALRFAMRSTVITRATSDSTAATTSPTERAVLAHHAQDAVARLGERREGLEGVESGRQATAVAFAVRRDRRLQAGGWRWWRQLACAVTLAIGSRRRKLSAAVRPQRPSASARIDAGKRLLAAQSGNRLEDARRDRRSGDRHPHRLEDVLGLGVEALDHAAQRLLDVLDVERLRPLERLARRAQPLRGAPSRMTFSQALRRRSPGARPGSRPAARSRPASASSPG